MPDFKYTKNGKKVAVIGKLNSEQWIVQEVYVSNGQEFPAGENFIETSLLDEPAETWDTKNKKALKEKILKLDKQIEQTEKDLQLKNYKANIAKLINRVTEKYGNVDIEQLDTLFAFMSGEITHVVTKRYGDYEICSLIDVLPQEDHWYNRPKLEGLKLVTLFGCTEAAERKDKDCSFSLNWKINQYRDGSGNCWITVYPCKSFDDAVKLLDTMIENENATDSLIKLKAKYNLNNPSPHKIDEHKQRNIDCKKKVLAEAEERVEKIKAELKEME